LKNQNVWIFYSCIKTATMGTWWQGNYLIII
jgi:hypothetical protein